MTGFDHGRPRRLLKIYLDDHLMGATGGRELARRAAQANAGTRFAPPLEELLTELGEDRASLLDLMRALDLPRNRLKMAAGVVGERVGRLKRNGQLRGYSPLSRLVELEGLHAGVNVKLRLWLTLGRIGLDGLGGVDIDRLVARGRSQLDRLEELRIEAAAIALGGGAEAREEAST